MTSQKGNSGEANKEVAELGKRYSAIYLIDLISYFMFGHHLVLSSYTHLELDTTNTPGQRYNCKSPFRSLDEDIDAIEVLTLIVDIA